MKTYVGRGVGAYIENKIFRAEDYLLISSPWISPGYAEKLVALADQRGVAIKVITSDKPENQGSIEVFRKRLTPKRDFLGRVKKDWAPPSIDLKVVRERFIHAKIYAVDGHYAVVGSPNFTEQGFWHNAEYILIFEKPEEVEQIENDFGQLWLQYTGEEIAEEKLGKAVTLEIFNRIFGRFMKK